jgi:hypothetical protein
MKHLTCDHDPKKAISLAIVVVEAFVFCSCAGPQEHQQAYAAYDTYDHTRCVGYGFEVLPPEYSQCRQLLAEMRAGGPLGTMAGLMLDRMANNRMTKTAVEEPNEPVDWISAAGSSIKFRHYN